MGEKTVLWFDKKMANFPFPREPAMLKTCLLLAYATALRDIGFMPSETGLA